MCEHLCPLVRPGTHYLQFGYRGVRASPQYRIVLFIKKYWKGRGDEEMWTSALLKYSVFNFSGAHCAQTLKT